MAAAHSYVLVHGGYHGAWCWERLVPLLDGPALAVDLAGRGAHPMDPADVHIESSADLVAADVAAAGLAGVVLVGHSLGGASLPAIAARLGSRVAALVFVGALVVPDGSTAFSGLSAEELADRLARLRVTEGARTQLAEETHRALLCNDMDDELAAWVLARVGPDSLHFFTDTVRWAPEVEALPTWYVRLSQDRAVPPEVAEVMISRLRSPVVHEIDVGHEVMLTQPGALAALLNAIDVSAVGAAVEPPRPPDRTGRTPEQKGET